MIASTPTRQERLDSEFRSVLQRLQLASQVSAQAYGGGSGAGSHPSSKPPSGVAHPAWEHLLADYNAAISDTDRARVLAWAKRELGSWRRSSTTIVPAVSLDTLIIEDGEGYDAEMVAQRYGLTTAHVRRIRQRAGRHPETGVDPEAASLPREKRRVEARRMRDKGMSQRQIAQVLGVSQPLIAGDLKAA